jgi:hypothetical protein
MKTRASTLQRLVRNEGVCRHCEDVVGGPSRDKLTGDIHAAVPEIVSSGVSGPPERRQFTMRQLFHLAALTPLPAVGPLSGLLSATTS